jgi:alkylation response protein AidB-like acyl-CoA dehydrogenase
VDFDEEGELAAYRPLARAWAAEHVDPDWSARGEHWQHYPGLHARLAADGILGAG